MNKVERQIVLDAQEELSDYQIGKALSDSGFTARLVEVMREELDNPSPLINDAFHVFADQIERINEETRAFFYD